MATSGRDLMSDEIVGIKCCVCVEKNRTREAEKYCCDCKDYYCTSCVGIHQDVPSMKRHTILNKADFRTLGQDGSLPSYPTQRCTLHITEVVNMYCMDHDEVACASCIALTHRPCKNVVSIPEDIDNLYNNVSFSEMKLKFSKTMETMKAMKKTRETKFHELKRVLNQKIEFVKAFRQELQALLDRLEQETIQELRREFNRIEASLEKDINESERLITSLQDAASQLKKSEGNRAQQFVSVKSSQKLLVMGEKVEKNQQIATDETVSFTSDDSIATFLRHKKTLGDVSITKPKTKGGSMTESDQSFTANVGLYEVKTKAGSTTKPDQTFTAKDSLYRVKKQKEINVKLQNDKKKCSIFGSCVTEDGYLLLADYSNNRLKCMDLSNYKMKAYIDLPAQPWGVCIISKTEAAVALNNQSIQFVSLGDKMTVIRTLTMKHFCYGIANKHGRLFISDNSKSVYMYDMNGQEQKIITNDSSGKYIFENNQHIAVSAVDDRVFVADFYKGLVVLDSQGNCLSTQSNIMSGISGVCTDGRNVFATGKKIVQLGQDYKILGEIGNVTYPFSLCFNQQKKQLIATFNNNNITILELE